MTFLHISNTRKHSKLCIILANRQSFSQDILWSIFLSPCFIFSLLSFPTPQTNQNKCFPRKFIQFQHRLSSKTHFPILIPRNPFLHFGLYRLYIYKIGRYTKTHFLRSESAIEKSPPPGGKVENEKTPRKRSSRSVLYNFFSFGGTLAEGCESFIKFQDKSFHYYERI